MSILKPDSGKFMQWRVKPVWKVIYPSEKIGEKIGEFEIFGVDRTSLNLPKNLGRIHSVERYNQGFKELPSEYSITIAVKEHGEAIEKLRRLSAGLVMFDIRCDVLRKTDESVVGDLSSEYTGSFNLDGYVPWLDGFEKYVGCVVNNEIQTVEIGEIPVREFEILFLERYILPSESGNYNDSTTSDGSGIYPTLEELGLL